MAEAFCTVEDMFSTLAIQSGIQCDFFSHILISTFKQFLRINWLCSIETVALLVQFTITLFSLVF